MWSLKSFIDTLVVQNRLCHCSLVRLNPNAETGQAGAVKTGVLFTIQAGIERCGWHEEEKGEEVEAWQREYQADRLGAW